MSHSFVFAGETFLALQSGALFHPERSLLMVADLHLEKGSAFARSGQFLPPYDSQMTLTQLEADIACHQPQTVICLGDSFHDVDGPNRLDEAVKDRLQALTSRLSWLWITGNHDPHLPESLGGAITLSHFLACAEGKIHLCHEPNEPDETNEPREQREQREPREQREEEGATYAEICGHLHPVATLAVRGRALRRKCFLVSEKQIIMPAYGAYTGGLNISDPAFAPFLTPSSRLLVIGRQTISAHPVRQAARSKR